MRDLPWLQPAPQDYAERLRGLRNAESGLGLHLQQLASFRLSYPQALSLTRLIRKFRKEERDLSPLTPFKLAVVASGTADFIVDHLPAAAARHGVALEIVQADYDVVIQEAFDPSSKVNVSGPDAILVAIDHRWLGLHLRVDDATAQVESAISKLLEVVRLFKDHSGGRPILPLLATPAESLFGSFDRLVAGTLASKISLVNQAILDFARDEGAYVFDVDSIARSVGVAEWFDPVAWNAQKQPFAAVFNPIYADRLGALLGAIRGKARKCLVLDLDNTLWGGAIGDEGLGGIVLGQGSAAGEAFLSVQRAAKALKERGVVLAVSSKNNDDVARSAFQEHTEMILSETDIAVFQANWSDKCANLEAIAATLNIGLDALVLLDDNPAERAQTRAALPMVAVPELPVDPAFFAQTLLAAGYFEAVSFSDDDVIRATSYTGNAQRAEVMAKSRDLGDYLSSLDMILTCGPVNPTNRARATQLINKSNQFNLMTRRLTETDVEALEADPSVITLQAKLADRFGDMGLITVVTAKVDGDEANVTDWLMSCRVLGRSVEAATYDTLMNALVRRGVKKVHAAYLPTKKNAMVNDHFDRLGLTRVHETEEGARYYHMSVADYTPPVLHLKIENTL